MSKRWRLIAAVVLERVQWWLAEVGRVASGRTSKVSYDAEWQLCRVAAWLRDE